ETCSVSHTILTTWGKYFMGCDSLCSIQGKSCQKPMKRPSRLGDSKNFRPLKKSQKGKRRSALSGRSGVPASRNRHQDMGTRRHWGPDAESTCSKKRQSYGSGQNRCKSPMAFPVRKGVQHRDVYRVSATTPSLLPWDQDPPYHRQRPVSQITGGSRLAQRQGKSH